MSDPRMHHIQNAIKALVDMGASLPSPRSDFPDFLRLLDAVRQGAYVKENSTQRHRLDGADFFDRLWGPDPVGFTNARLCWTFDAWSRGERAPDDWPHPLVRVVGRCDTPVSILYATALSELAPDFLCWRPEFHSDYEDAFTLSIGSTSLRFSIFEALAPIWKKLASSVPAISASLDRAQLLVQSQIKNSGASGSADAEDRSWVLSVLTAPYIDPKLDAAALFALEYFPVTGAHLLGGSAPDTTLIIPPDADAARTLPVTPPHLVDTEIPALHSALDERIATLEVMVATQHAALESLRQNRVPESTHLVPESGHSSSSGRGRVGRG